MAAGPHRTTEKPEEVVRQTALEILTVDQQMTRVIAVVLGLWIISMVLLFADQFTPDYALLISIGISMIGAGLASYSKLAKTEQKVVDMAAAVRSIDDRIMKLEDRIFSIARERDRD